ncbi:MAG: histidine phosphatase family protein [Pseudomonadales bacterium]|nr:histidine phosphatase family protein [Pseudomonadales bacterium]
MKSVLKFSLGLKLLIICLLQGQMAAAETTVKTAPELIEALKQGGYIVYLRHAKTLQGSESRDQKDLDFKRCETQRNLSEAGQTQAKKIGKTIKALQIPIAQIWASPYCRTKDTAMAVFGNYEVDSNLAFSIAKNQPESQRLGNYLRSAMLSADLDNGNVVFVGHTANLKDGLGIWPKPEGVAVIFKRISGEILYQGIIPPSAWSIPDETE